MMIKKVVSASLCLLLTFALAGTAAGGPSAKPAGRSAAQAPAAAAQRVVKDETVYLSLKACGETEQINVVNRIETPQSGSYTDYGDYEAVTNLTNGVKPAIGGGAVTWQLEADGKGFYYQGRLREGEPPFLFTIKYYLDGVETPADALAGASGAVAIHVEARPNAAAAAYFRENYFCQVQASLDLDRCRDITAEGSTKILTGRSQVLGFTVLPGNSAAFEISFSTDDFSFDGFTMTAMPFDQASLTGIDTGNLREDIRKMSDGTQELVDGTKELKDGLVQLSDGVADIAAGAAGAKSGLARYKSGVQDYTGGVTALAANARQLAQGMQSLAQNGQALKSGYAELSAGVDAVLAQLTPAAPPELAGQIALLRGQLTAYQQGLDSYVAGVSEMAAGMGAFADGLDQLGDSGPELVSGLASILKGMTKLADGLSEMADEMEPLPSEITKLIDGQSELKDGVDEAAGMFDEWDFGADPQAAPVSFVSPQNAPRSVQFIYKTAEIAGNTEEEQPSEPARREKSFFEKLAELFR